MRRRRRLDDVAFCEACGVVCDRACRARAQREAARDHAVRLGLGVLR